MAESSQHDQIRTGNRHGLHGCSASPATLNSWIHALNDKTRNQISQRLLLAIEAGNHRLHDALGDPPSPGRTGAPPSRPARSENSVGCGRCLRGTGEWHSVLRANAQLHRRTSADSTLWGQTRPSDDIAAPDGVLGQATCRVFAAVGQIAGTGQKTLGKRSCFSTSYDSCSPQANCARPWPRDQFSFAASITFTNTSSGRMPGLSSSSSAIRRNSAFFWSTVRVLNTVI